MNIILIKGCNWKKVTNITLKIIWDIHFETFFFVAKMTLIVRWREYILYMRCDCRLLEVLYICCCRDCYSSAELPDRSIAAATTLLPLSTKDKDGGRTKEENLKLLNGNSGDPTDRVRQT